MGASAAIMMATSAVTGAYTSSANQKMTADFEKSQANANARIADINAKDAIKRGDKEAANHKNKTKQLQGSQRAAMAAQGIDISSGSAGDIITETGEMGALDALTIKNNAYREAWGYRADAVNRRSQGAFAGLAGRNASRNTLLTGGLQAAGYAADYGRKSDSGKKD